MPLFYQTEIERVYLVNGLARSGNHLFISWLISSFSGNSDGVYYLNNIKPNYYGLTSKKKLNLKKIKKYHTVCRNNKYGLKIDKEIRGNLQTVKNMNDFLSGRKRKIKTLILSMENKNAERLDDVEKIFRKAKKIYKVIVIRDILNLFASRIESEKIYKENSDSWQYSTDKVTIDYWVDNYKNSKTKKYIPFNYNKFVCYSVTRRALAKKLEINEKKAKITLNLYGLTKGSSFGEDANYFMRWTKKKHNPLIKKLLNNKTLIKILCKDFSMCMNSELKGIKVCKKKIKIDL